MPIADRDNSHTSPANDSWRSACHETLPIDGQVDDDPSPIDGQVEETKPLAG